MAVTQFKTLPDVTNAPGVGLSCVQRIVKIFIYAGACANFESPVKNR
jgi:hypothetical protein